MLRVYLLGGFRVEVDGRIIEDSAWSRRKVKNLLKLLVLQPDFRLHKEQVLDLLWADLDREAAFNNLYKTLHLLRHTLEPELRRTAESNFIATKDNHIRLNPFDIWLDITAFQQLVADSKLEEAVALYKGDLLEEDLYEEWAISKRQALRLQYCKALFNLAKQYREIGNYNRAIAHLRQLLARDALHEQAHQALMYCYALAGRRSEAMAQYQQCHQMLELELGVEPSPETQQLYEQIRAGEVTANNAVNFEGYSKTVFDNLPTPLTPLIDRETEVVGIVSLLKDEKVRLLTLVGTGGVGKTRVALQAARQLLATNIFANGVCFVPLVCIDNQTLLSVTVAQALGLKESDAVSLQLFLRDKELLLVLDNFEQLVDAAPRINEWLSTCPKLKILVTSRFTLHLYGEHEQLIQPLPLPDPEPPLSLANLGQSPAIALFLQRAQAAKSNFRLDNDNAHAIIEICRRSEGLPLAIELAAASVKLLSPQLILAGLSSWLDLGSTTSHSRPTNRHSLRDVLDWSYNLMDEEEQQLFALLGVFSGGFTLEAIEALDDSEAKPNTVSSNEGANSLKMLNLTTALINKSLIYRDEKVKAPENSLQTPLRFKMLKIIGDYAIEKLGESGLANFARERQLTYFMDLAERLEPKLHSPVQTTVLDTLELEHDNLRVALAWSLITPTPDGLLKGLRLAGTLTWFWYMRGYRNEGSQWLETLLAQAENRQADLSPFITPNIRARVLYGAGVVNLYQGNYAKANQYLSGSLSLYQEVADKRIVALTLNGMAELARQQGNLKEAHSLFEASLALWDELNDHWRYNHGLIGLGLVNYQMGNVQGGQAYFEQALTACRVLNDKFGIARTLNALGELMHALDNYSQAQTFYEESLSVYQELNHAGNIALVLYNLAQLAHSQAHYTAASKLLKSSLVINYRIKSKRFLMQCLMSWAGIEVAQGDPLLAARLLGCAETVREKLGAKLTEVNQSLYLRDVAKLREKLDLATLAIEWEAGSQLDFEQVILTLLEL